MGYIATALKGSPEQPFAPPSGVITVRINPDTGTRAEEGDGGLVDYFYQEFPPPEGGGVPVGMPTAGERPAEEVRNQLF
jgi:penicillin-binding protein 1A